MICRPRLSILQVIFCCSPEHKAIELSYQGLLSAVNGLHVYHGGRHNHRWVKDTDITSLFWNGPPKGLTTSHCQRLCSPKGLMFSRSLALSSRVFAGVSKNLGLQLNDSSDCLVFDENGILIRKFILKDARAHAQAKHSRLVYLNKNKDGMNCFKLQPLLTSASLAQSQIGAEKTSEDADRDINIGDILKDIKPVTRADGQIVRTKNANKYVPKDSNVKATSSTKQLALSDDETMGAGTRNTNEDTPKDTPKEFTIKSKIKEHDLLIKTTKMKSLLTKGKPVKVIIQYTEAEKDGGSSLAKKLMEELKSLGKLQTETSGKTASRFTVTPTASQPKQSAS
uniref:Uncharacterized protein n=1 Tax=Biomphalaria glabrata TaxID=6526 RepID=A0A2C9KP99_BIOGL